MKLVAKEGSAENSLFIANKFAQKNSRISVIRQKTDAVKKILVIVVTYNGMEWIGKCIESMIASTLLPKIMVIDNASTDETVLAVQKYPQVLLVENRENTGFGQANNIGLKYALEQQYDYVFLINQDTAVRPDMFEIMIKVHVSHPGYGILSPLHMNGTGHQFDRHFHQCLLNGCPEYVNASLLKQQEKPVYPIFFVNAAFWLLSRDCIEKTGGFDPLFFHRGEDNDYCNRARFNGFQTGLCPQAAGLHFRENRTEPSTYGNYYSTQCKDILVHLKNPFSQPVPIFLSTLSRIFLSGLRYLFRFRFLMTLIHWKMIAFMFRHGHKVKQSRESERSPLSHLKI